MVTIIVLISAVKRFVGVAAWLLTSERGTVFGDGSPGATCDADSRSPRQCMHPRAPLEALQDQHGDDSPTMGQGANGPTGRSSRPHRLLTAPQDQSGIASLPREQTRFPVDNLRPSSGTSSYTSVAIPSTTFSRGVLASGTVGIVLAQVWRGSFHHHRVVAGHQPVMMMDARSYPAGRERPRPSYNYVEPPTTPADSASHRSWN